MTWQEVVLRCVVGLLFVDYLIRSMLIRYS